MSDKFPKIPTELAERKEWIDFMYNHPVVNDIEKCHFHLDIRPAYVNPETRRIEDDESSNTHSEIWIEGGPPADMKEMEFCEEPAGGWNPTNRWMNSHDYRLDCGGDTLEEALLKFTARIKYYYNDDGSSRTDEDH
jgi:hypothetical protein